MINVKHLNFQRFYEIFKNNYPRKMLIVPFSDGQTHRHFYVRCGRVLHTYSTFDYKEFRNLAEIMEK